jgi:hypothetical protein
MDPCGRDIEEICDIRRFCGVTGPQYATGRSDRFGRILKKKKLSDMRVREHYTLRMNKEAGTSGRSYMGVSPILAINVYECVSDAVR